MKFTAMTTVVSNSTNQIAAAVILHLPMQINVSLFLPIVLHKNVMSKPHLLTHYRQLTSAPNRSFVPSLPSLLDAAYLLLYRLLLPKTNASRRYLSFIFPLQPLRIAFMDHHLTYVE